VPSIATWLPSALRVIAGGEQQTRPQDKPPRAHHVYREYDERMKWAAALCTFALGACSAADRTSTAPANSSDSAWFVSGWAKRNYRLWIDPAVTHDGKPTTTVQRVSDESVEGSYVTIMMETDARPLQRHRVRARVFVRTQGLTGRADVWARVQAATSPRDGPGLGGGNVRLDPTSDFRSYEITFDVPPEGEHVQLGVGRDGPGELWVGHGEIAPID
jgi:hypothetical protein